MTDSTGSEETDDDSSCMAPPQEAELRRLVTAEVSPQPILLKDSVQASLAAASLLIMIALAFTCVLSLVGANEEPQPYRLTIDLNTACSEELQLVPGIGIVTAGRIVAARERLGRFASFDELANVRGVGPKTIAELQKHCKSIGGEPPRRRKTLVAIRK